MRNAWAPSSETSECAARPDSSASLTGRSWRPSPSGSPGSLQPPPESGGCNLGPIFDAIAVVQDELQLADAVAAQEIASHTVVAKAAPEPPQRDVPAMAKLAEVR